jgi:hypothetical protein
VHLGKPVGSERLHHAADTHYRNPLRPKWTACGEGPGVLRRATHFQDQPACKPGSVGHHSCERYVTAIPLGPRLHMASSNQPGRRARHRPAVLSHEANHPRCRPYSVLLPVGFALPSPLPETRCALTAPFHPCCPPFRVGKRFVLCGTFPGVAPAGCYPAPYVDGARTFLSRGLSARAGAAVRPTDTPIAMGLGREKVKAFPRCGSDQNKLF